MTTEYWVYVDYGSIGDPGAIIQENEVGRDVVYTGKDYVIDDPRFRADDPRDRVDLWDEILAEHGWERVKPWSHAGDQSTTIVERVQQEE